MSNYTITEETNTLTLTLKNNTKYGKTIYNNTAYYNNTTDKMLQAKKNGTWNCFSLLTLDQVIIPRNTHFHANNKIILTFKDVKGLTSNVTIPLLFKDFEEEISKQFNPAQVNNMGYMYGFIKTVLFDIYTDSTVLKKITLYNPSDVTLTLETADTETLTNAALTLTAKDKENNAIKGLTVSGTIGETSVTGTTGNDGTYTYTIETAGTYAVSLATAATEDYNAETITDSVTVATITPAEEGTNEETPEEPTQDGQE